MTKTHWWRDAVFYQVYPRSFADGNGDGVGDLPGLISRLDYLRDLGVDALWLSPHYPSPQYDCGYDVTDYTGVAPEYGALDDFQRFLDGAHARGLRVVLDLVLNHTSHEHPWFLDSRRGRASAHHDWYVWHPGRNGGPPNNWLSAFGGSAWEYVPARGEYYYHYFFKQQPDLNWRCRAVKQAMFDVMRFWLDRGVDGFRIDAIGAVFEDPTLADHTSPYTALELLHQRQAEDTSLARERQKAAYRLLFAHQIEQPGVHALARELRSTVDEYNERVLIGETEDPSYYGRGDDELHLVFNFPLMDTPRLTPAWVRANQQARLAGLPPGAWPCNTLGNHDSPRVYSRYGDGRHDAELARLALALLLTLPGTPFLYNGEEIGMTDLRSLDLNDFRDLIGVWRYHAERQERGVPHAEALALAVAYGRDKCRAPLQWANAPNGGFCPAAVRPWLPVNPNYAAGVNVTDQDGDPASLLNFYRRLLRARRAAPVLRRGTYLPLHPEAEAYLALLRQADQASGEPAQRVLVVLNFSSQAVEPSFDLGPAQARCLYRSGPRPGEAADLQPLTLGPFEIFIGEL